MKKILLCTVPFARNPAWYLPLGLLSIATSLRRRGVAVDILDIDGERLSKEEVTRFFDNNHYEIVGISALTSLYNYTKWMAEVIKKRSPETKIVLGGNLSSSHPTFILNNTLVDICVYGEGEETMPDLIDCLDNNRDLADVEGIYYRKNGEILSSQPRPLLADLDSIAPVDYGLVSLNKYLFPGSLIATRGCTHRCTYCFQPLRGIRRRSPQSLFEEIRLLREKHKIRFFTFLDSYFLADKKFLNEFCTLIKKLEIRWACNERLDHVDEEALSKMKESGCIRISYGIESYNQQLLDEMCKGTKLKQIERGLEISQKSKIKQICGSFIVGFFQESEETMRRNIEFAKRWKMASYCFYLTPFPGTRLYSEAIKRGFIRDEKKYFEEHIGRGDEFQSVSNRFYLNMSPLTDEQLINGYESFAKELKVDGSLLFKVKESIKIAMPSLSNFVSRSLRR